VTTTRSVIGRYGYWPGPMKARLSFNAKPSDQEAPKIFSYDRLARGLNGFAVCNQGSRVLPLLMVQVSQVGNWHRGKPIEILPPIPAMS